MMNQHNAKAMASALFGDSNAMLKAVASLLTKQQGTKDQDTLLASPVLVLTNMPDKNSLLADVILGTSHCKNSASKSDVPHCSEALLPSFEEVHALATANLVASTQRDIAKQLAEANSTHQHESEGMKGGEKRSKKQESRETSKKEKLDCAMKSETKKTSQKSAPEQPLVVLHDVRLTQRSEPKALICSFEGCGRKFAWLNHLKYHELTHTNNRQFQCPVESCGKTFFTAQRLSVHQRTHTGEKPFKCSHQNCGKTFTTAGNLKNHHRIHTGEQPYVCDLANCNKRFTELSSLRKHKLTHSGDKPFECQICGKKFTQSGSRQQHLIRHHLDDEIRKSLKRERSEKTGDDVDDDDEDEVRGKVPGESRTTSIITTKSKSVKAISCSPQVLVLNNAYPGLPTSESIVFTHGLSDHIVNVKARSVDQPMTDPNSLSLSHTLLNSEGLHDGVLHDKSDDLVVLSETSMYQHEENPGDIVYTADILDHEEVTHADYVSSHVDYSEEMVHTNYPHHGEITNGDDYIQREIPHPETYTSHSGDIASSQYIPAECIHHVPSYAHSKHFSHCYLDSQKGVVHREFIGAEEVPVACYTDSKTFSLPFLGSKRAVASAELSATEDIIVAQFSSILTSTDVTLDRDVHRKVSMAAALSSSSVMTDLTNEAAKFRQDTERTTSPVGTTSDIYMTSSMPNARSGVVASHSAHSLETGLSDQEIDMDPMMECDEEPDKQLIAVS